MKEITIAGSGYVGLVTGACFAEMGHKVTFYDINQEQVDCINNGSSPIHEHGLSELINKNRNAGRIVATTDMSGAFERFSDDIATRRPDIVFVCVGTPGDETGNVDLTQIEEVTNAFRFGTHGGQKESLFVIKSTVPPGTCRRIQEKLGDMAEVVSNPEFLAEGCAVTDFMRPDRVVVGARSDEAFRIMREIYTPFLRSYVPFIEMSCESAELAKYACNAHLATRISLMNELAMISRMFGADIEDVRMAVGSDRRIGRHFLYAGIGFGGSCFPKDLRALRAAGCSMMIEHALLVNDMVRDDFYLRVRMALGGSYCDKKIAVWGLSFKPGTDDVRESPAVEIIREMLDEGATVRAYDPEASVMTPFLTDNERYHRVKAQNDVLYDADALLVLTEWPEFRTPDFDAIGRLMNGKVIGDGRNIYDPTEMSVLGFNHIGVGR